MINIKETNLNKRINSLIKFSSFLKIAILISMLGFLSSCSTQTEQIQPVQEQEEYVYHRVKFNGETYSIIANWYTKSSKNTNLLIELNPTIKPTRIKIGDLIKIPKSLLVRPKSLPQDFVNSSAGTKKSKSKADVDVVPVDPTENESNLNNNPETDTSNYDYTQEVQVEPEIPVQPEVPVQQAEQQIIEQEAAPVAALEQDQQPAQVQVPPPAEDANSKIREKLMQELLE